MVALAASGGAPLSAQQAEPWWPASGAVLLAGGNLQQETADAFVDRIIALAGGPNASIVIIPTAQERPDTAALRAHFASRGARHVVFLDARSRDVANSESFVRPLRTANAVFFTGGRARVLDRTYHDTLFEREIKALLARGGVLAGDSAGAITLGCEWLGWSSNTGPFGVVTRGLCVLPGLSVTPHVRRDHGRVAENEMTDSVRVWIAHHPELIGINIEENTALVMHGRAADVIGPGGVSLMNQAGVFLRVTREAPATLGR